jgi:hypothetical protein
VCLRTQKEHFILERAAAAQAAQLIIREHGARQPPTQMNEKAAARLFFVSSHTRA